MGFDGLISFLIRNLPNDAFDDIDLKINHNKLLSKYVMIDISFILYNCYLEVEDDINNILKYICGLSCSNYTKILNLIETQLMGTHWKNININLDGGDQSEICKNFIKQINQNNNEILDKIMLKNVGEKLKTLLSNIFSLEFVDEVVLFFDSIPSYSKILEQRKRRLKNYLESQNRKEYYKEYFTNLKSRIIQDETEEFEYDYFCWISNKFNCNKIIDSNSNFIKKLKEYLTNELKFEDSNKVKIKVDEEEYGEADYKIFKYISLNNLEDVVTILSCDSDLVYQIITQQLNYLTMDKSTNLNLCKFYINSFDHCQHYNANKIIDNLNNNYKECNNVSNPGEFCLDFMIILNFFGNDLLPSSFEIGPELSLNTLMKAHYFSLGKEDKSLISNYLSEDGDMKPFKKLDLLNLKNFLKEISKTSIFTKIILLRFYKIPYNIVSIFTDKLNFDLLDVKNFMEEYLILKGFIEIEKKKNILDKNDIRLIKYEKFKLKCMEKFLDSQNDNVSDVKSETSDKNKVDTTSQAEDNNESIDPTSLNQIDFKDGLSQNELFLNFVEKNLNNPLKSYNYNNNITNFLIQLENLLDDYLDYLDLDNLGLLNSSENLELEYNMYQNLYNYISSKSNLDRGTYSNFKLLGNDNFSKNTVNIEMNTLDTNNNKGTQEDSIKSEWRLRGSDSLSESNDDEILIDFNLKMEDSPDEQVENYLLVLSYIVKSFFNDMCNYVSTNLTVYKYDNVPSISNLISFLDKNNLIELSKKFDDEINNNVLSKDKYFNPILHHLIITPYLLESNYLNMMTNKHILNELINNFDSILSNIWNYQCFNFEFIKSNKFIKDRLKYIDPKLILKSWNDLLIKMHKIQKLDVKENFLLEF